jgi:hypothetical protein
LGLVRETSDVTLAVQSAAHDVATAYDGFTIFPSSGTIAGTIRVYGYKNS